MSLGHWGQMNISTLQETWSSMMCWSLKANSSWFMMCWSCWSPRHHSPAIPLTKTKGTLLPEKSWLGNVGATLGEAHEHANPYGQQDCKTQLNKAKQISKCLNMLTLMQVSNCNFEKWSPRQRGNVFKWQGKVFHNLGPSRCKATAVLHHGTKDHSEALKSR